ncbi:MAG: polysaccharide deacetylase family protein [Nitrosopumilus sp.]|nr:polysaccharide deacetylase family protein [Nitrosopumilus sp.]MDH3515893.1 polysaccharide deacetylase family protein [Nitrosopumilus sp.]MDH3564817.1 polysaccharide deacetylase family protein [Nitrosopumilus sp.]MDH5417880.1 polysaccharide deacetylase family protein [Nitrosopumilus sp.]MDH5554651.1 polysaccharide deacetylase family protein [Nitrosopumilus sp.]
MKNWLWLLVILALPAVFAYAETSTVELTIVDSNEDPINSWGMYVEIFSENDRKTPILKMEQPVNPSKISLEKGKYVINIYRHDMFVGYHILTIDDSTKKIKIPIGDLGGTLFTIYYDDNKPIQGAKVEIFSHKGIKWAEDVTGNDGRTERFWLQIPNGINDYYSAKISLSEEVSYTVPKFRFAQGLNNEIIKTPWKSVVDDLIKIQLYKNIREPISGYDGEFAIELYNNNNDKVTQSKVDSHGEATFSNVPVGFYFLRVLDSSNSESKVWAIKEILVHKNMGEIKIFESNDQNIDYEINSIKNKSEIESPDETCNCVAFRLDNVQDYYLIDVQEELINLFLSKDVPLTVGIIGENFGSDAELTNFLKTTISKNDKLIGIGNHGGTSDITTMNKDEQLELIRNTNNNISDLIEKKPSVFIPPFGRYNTDTISVLNQENIQYISSVSSFDVAPYPLKDESLFRFPSTASTGYIEQGRAWYGIPANQTMNDIKFSVRDYGFAVVLLHPHEYSKRSGWVFENQLDVTQYFELDELIDEVKNYGLKIVLIDDINTETRLFSIPSIPNWFKSTTSWWVEDKINTSGYLRSIEYLIEKKIIQVPQIDIDIQDNNKNTLPVFKNNAKLWVQDKMSDKKFINEIEILIQQDIVHQFKKSR